VISEWKRNAGRKGTCYTRIQPCRERKILTWGDTTPGGAHLPLKGALCIVAPKGKELTYKGQLLPSSLAGGQRKRGGVVLP